MFTEYLAQHPCMVYLPTFNNEHQPKVGKCVSPMDAMGMISHFIEIIISMILDNC